MPIGMDGGFGYGEIAFGFDSELDRKTEATLRALLRLLDAPELSALSPLKLHLRSSSVVYAVEGQVQLPRQMQTLLSRVRDKCRQGNHELYTVRSLAAWTPLDAWVVAEFGGESWAVLVSGEMVARPEEVADLEGSGQSGDRRIASGGPAAWRPVNPTLGSR